MKFVLKWNNKVIEWNIQVVSHRRRGPPCWGMACMAWCSTSTLMRTRMHRCPWTCMCRSPFLITGEWIIYILYIFILINWFHIRNMSFNVRLVNCFNFTYYFIFHKQTFLLTAGRSLFRIISCGLLLYRYLKYIRISKNSFFV